MSTQASRVRYAPQTMPVAARSTDAPKPKGAPRGKPWPKGVSGNPTGNRKGVAAAARELIGDDPAELLKVFLSIAKNTRAKHGDRVTAAREYLDRAYGKAPAYALIEGEDPLALTNIDSSITDVLDELAARRETQAPRESTPGTLGVTSQA